MNGFFIMAFIVGLLMVGVGIIHTIYNPDTEKQENTYYAIAVATMLVGFPILIIINTLQNSYFTMWVAGAVAFALACCFTGSDEFNAKEYDNKDRALAILALVTGFLTVAAMQVLQGDLQSAGYSVVGGIVFTALFFYLNSLLNEE